MAVRVFFLPSIAFLVCLLTSFGSRALAQEPPRDDSKSEDLKKPEDTRKPDDVKHDTPGLPVKPGELLHRDVDLALVNVTVTDPYNRLVTGLDQENFRSEGVKHDTPGLPVKPGELLHRDVDLALVNVTVTDPYNRLVTGLDQENFRVFEDNIEQEVMHFSSEDVPISIGVIFDVSGSMANKINKSREAAVQFFKTANPQDEFFLVSFNERAELTSVFTNSVEDLQSRMAFMAAKGRTALLDAIYLGLSQLRGAHNAKRALLIISDGGDN